MKYFSIDTSQYNNTLVEQFPTLSDAVEFWSFDEFAIVNEIDKDEAVYIYNTNRKLLGLDLITS